MRIIGGICRGQKIKAPDSIQTRPTLDRVRESVFSVLMQGCDFQGQSVLDLFAGSGSMGLEALSRGASYCTFVEINKIAQEILTENIKKLGFANKSNIIRDDALNVSQAKRPVRVVFWDPPYEIAAKGKYLTLLSDKGWISEDTWIVLETDCQENVDYINEFQLIKEAKYGRVLIKYLSFMKKD